MIQQKTKLFPKKPACAYINYQSNIFSGISMNKRPITILTIAIASAVALLLLVGGGATSDTSDGANTYTIDGAGLTWAGMGTTINLLDGDTLTIGPGAGSPSSATTINIEADANVTINGNGLMITDLCIYESTADTKAHTVNIKDLKITAPTSKNAYNARKGILTLTGDNEFKGNGSIIAFIGGDSDTGTKIAGSGSLTVSTTSNPNAIACYKLELRETAKVTFSAVSGQAMYMTGSTSSIKVAGGARLNVANTGGGAHAIYFPYSGTHTIECDGVMTASATWSSGAGIVVGTSTSTLNISGSGVVNATGYNGIYSGGKLSMSRITVNCTGQEEGMDMMANELTLTGKATLNLKGNIGKAFMNIGDIVMGLGSTAVLTNGAGANETCTFKMETAGNLWAVSGTASFVSPSVATDTQAQFAIPAGTTGTIKLVSAPKITGPTSMTLTVGYAAASSGAFTLTGVPAPTVSITADPKITWGGDKLNVAAGLGAGTYPVTLTATNGNPPDATFNFTLTVNPSGVTPTVANVTVSSTSTSIAKGATQTFTAVVTGSGGPSQAVSWTVEGKTDANTNITSAGLLTVGAAETATSLTVKATSIQDPTKSGTLNVTVASGTGGDSEEGGGGNALIFAAVAVVVIAAIVGVVYFMFIRKP